MPQIWLTYREFAALINCEPVEARIASITTGLDRRKSRDGLTRVKLTEPLADAFLDIVMRQFLECEIGACANHLRSVHEQMAKPFPRTEPLTVSDA